MEGDSVRPIIVDEIFRINDGSPFILVGILPGGDGIAASTLLLKIRGDFFRGDPSAVGLESVGKKEVNHSDT